MSKLYQYEGRMHTVAEIAVFTGMNQRTIRNRLASSVPLDAPMGKQRLNKLYTFRGELRTAHDIGAELGISPQRVRALFAAGRELDNWESPEKRSATNLTDDELRYDQDRAAQQVMRYFRAMEPISTDAEIREFFRVPEGPTTSKYDGASYEISDAGVARVREWLANEMFVARRHSGGVDGEQLELVGETFGVTRERVRQMQNTAIARSLRNAERGGFADEIRAELAELDESRTESVWDAIERHSPGDVGWSDSGKGRGRPGKGRAA